MERACGFDRSELHRDEGPPIVDMGVEPWPAALILAAGTKPRVPNIPSHRDVRATWGVRR
jgi:hypothetical protein